MHDRGVEDGAVEARSRRVHEVLAGVQVGDGFGQRFLEPDGRRVLAERALPPAPWTVTDDSVLSVALAAHLRRHEGVDPQAWRAATERLI